MVGSSIERQLSVDADLSVGYAVWTTPVDVSFPTIGTWRSQGSRDRVESTDQGTSEAGFARTLLQISEALSGVQSFHKKPSTPAGSIVPSTSHMCIFCHATLSILDRPSRKSLKRDQSTIPGDAQRSRGTLSWGTWDFWNKLLGTADAAPDFGVRGRSIAGMAPECRPRSHVVDTIAQAGKWLPQ